MHKDSSNRLTISSPIEAHQSNAIVFSICGVDNVFANPIFAVIELEYEESGQEYGSECKPCAEKERADRFPTAAEVEKRLAYYELDLGNNVVEKKWSEPISRTANFLLSVPGAYYVA
jgi:splicing factor 3B subunit 3